jgi:hypothetical protein
MKNIEKLANEIDYLRTSGVMNYNGILQCINKNIGLCKKCEHKKLIKNKDHIECKLGYGIHKSNWFCADYDSDGTL